MATITFLESGTDATQDLSFFPAANSFLGGTAVAVSSSTQAFTGSRAMKLTVNLAGSGGGADLAYVSTPDGVCADAGTRASVRVWLLNLPALQNCSIFQSFEAGFGNGIFALVVTPAGKFQLFGNNGATTIGAAGGTTVTTGAWHRISQSWVITTGTNWTYKLYIDGVLEFTRTNSDATLTVTGTSELSAALDSLGHAIDAMTVYYDDWIIDNGSDLADIGAALATGITDANRMRVTAKRPFANGTTNGFTTQIGAGGSGYGSGHSPQVNEQPLSTTNGWSMIGAGSAITEEYNIEGASVGDIDISAKSINGVMGWVYAKSLISETGKIVVNGTQTNISLTSTNTLFTQLASSQSTYSAGTGTDIGIVTSTTVTTVSLYEAGILYAFSNAPTATENQDWMGNQPRQLRRWINIGY